MGPAGKSTLIVLLMIAGLAQSACAATYTVGGNTGWNLGVSATFFDDWAKPFKFAVGDTLGTFSPHVPDHLEQIMMLLITLTSLSA